MLPLLGSVFIVSSVRVSPRELRALCPPWGLPVCELRALCPPWGLPISLYARKDPPSAGIGQTLQSESESEYGCRPENETDFLYAASLCMAVQFSSAGMPLSSGRNACPCLLEFALVHHTFISYS